MKLAKINVLNDDLLVETNSVFCFSVPVTSAATTRLAKNITTYLVTSQEMETQDVDVNL